jgi:PadR family transcriptional regulator
MARPPADRVELLQGTLDMLVLRTLRPGPAHGHEIAKHIQRTSDEVLQVEHGSLYPALHRLEHQEWIVAEWATSELGRRAKYYRLTASGRRQLERETESWERLADAIGRVLRFA